MAGTFVVSACASPPSSDERPGPPTAICQPGPARSGIGQPYSAALAEELRAAANARTVREIGPDTAVTMEFLDDRLNLVVDRSGFVTEIRCG